MVIAGIILLFLLVIASTWWAGLWGNFITLINILIAGMVASSVYEPFAATLAESLVDYSTLADFMAVWILFVGTFLVSRILTDVLSPNRVKFDKITELVGRSLLSIWVACVFVAFTLFTFHMAPLHPDAFQADVETSTLGIGPDRMWLAFIQSRSRGALSSSTASNMFVSEFKPSTHPDDAGLDARVFDPHAKFIDRYHAKRAKLSQQNHFSEDEREEESGFEVLKRMKAREKKR